MKITEIKSPAKKAGLYRISIDNKPLGQVTAEDIFELGLVPNKVIDLPVYEALTLRIKTASMYGAALKYIDRRLRSKAEVSQYLYTKGCEPENAKQIIARLDKLGVIDENKLAEAYIHDVSLGRPLSRRAIVQKLRQKSIDKTTIETELEKADYLDTRALDELIAKKGKLSTYASNQPRFFRYLLSQGFSYEAIVARIGRPEHSSSRQRSNSRTTFK